MTDTPWTILNARITRVIDRLDALPTFREATVAATSPLAVRFDTDSFDTLVFATLVSGLAAGDRVLTLRFGRLPWVIGRRGGPRVPSVHLAQATSTFTASTTAQAVPGTSITLDLSAGDVVQALGVFDLDSASSIFLGRLLIDGVLQTGEAHMQSNARTTVSQVWQWTASSSGSHTVALSVAMLSGSAEVYASHTRLSLVVIPAP